MTSVAALPIDADSLRLLVASQQHELVQLRQALGEEQRKSAELQEQLRLLLHKRFGVSSEQTATGDLGVFNEAEAEADEHSDMEAPVIEVSGHQRRRRGRKPLPASLPRVEIVYELTEAERHCPHDGTPLTVIGREISEQLDIIPAKIQVLRHVRLKYACRCCEQHVRLAAPPALPIPKSLASAGVLAFVAVSKYTDALPLYRQQTIFTRLGVELPRATLANWMIAAGQLVQPLINLLRERLLEGQVLQMDETTIQVLKEPGRAATTTSYMWVQRAGTSEPPIVLYDYDASRSSVVPVRLLEGFQGYLQTDGYEGYNAVISAQNLIDVGCFAHARRKFDEALKAQPKPDPNSLAGQALTRIRALYRIERTLETATPEQRYQARQTQSVPLLDSLRGWLDSVRDQVPPSSLTGKALRYLDQQWPRLIRYCLDGRLAIDNNACERAIRPFTTGRKNWLFCSTVRGAKASANLYSLVETAKANGLEPYQYLRHIFTEIPKAKTCESLEVLLPHNLSPEQIAIQS